VCTDPLIISHPHCQLRMDHPQREKPSFEWPTLLHRIHQGEAVSKAAGDDGVPDEAVLHALRAARKQRIGKATESASWPKQLGVCSPAVSVIF
jgi:hypothetical protein